MAIKMSNLRAGDLVKLSFAALEGGYDNDPESANSVGIVLGFEYNNFAKPIVYWAQDESIHAEQICDLDLVK